MRFEITGFLVVLMAFFAAGLFAEEPEKNALDTSLKISGVIYTEYAYLTGYQPGKAWNQQLGGSGTFKGQSADRNSTFRITRVYINFKKNFTETLSMWVTTDVEGTDTTALTLYLKYAFLQYRETFFDFFTVNFQFGLISTPIVGLLVELGDCRWIYNDLYNISANLLRGQSWDSSADFGVRLGFTIANMVTLTGAVVNGEGFKKALETTGTNFDGKAYYATVSITPVGSLYINGFFRYEEDVADDTPSSNGISSELVYGFGMAWAHKLVRIGAHMFHMWNNDKSNIMRARTSYDLIEIYLLASLGEAVPSFPLLIHGRYGYGIEHASDAANGGADYATQMIACGIGWRFNDALRVLAYYESFIYDRDTDPGYELFPDARNFMVKAEIAF